MRDFIEWTDELSVGIQEIDEQHRILISLINQLYDAIINKIDSLIINDILEELVQYTVVHFAVEESLMRIFDYSQYDDHKHQHEELKQQVFDLQRKVKTGEVQVGMELLHFLRNWLKKHILITDKKYTSFFLERGLKQSWSQKTWAGKIWQSVFSR